MKKYYVCAIGPDGDILLAALNDHYTATLTDAKKKVKEAVMELREMKICGTVSASLEYDGEYVRTVMSVTV